MAVRISAMEAGTVGGDDLLVISQLSAITYTATTISADASDNSLNDSAGQLLVSGFAAGQAIKIAGFTGDIGNNHDSAVILTCTATKAVLRDETTLVTDAAGESVTLTRWKSYSVTAQDVADLAAAGTVADDSITNAKLAEVATATIKGRTTAGTGNPEDLTAAQAAAIVQGDGLTADLCGFRGVPQNSQSAAYTLVAADAGKHILHPSADANARTFTIPANGSVAYPVGTAITFVNQTAEVVSIAITTDTLTLAGTTTTGTRSLAQNGVATAIKITSTSWIISGTGLT